MWERRKTMCYLTIGDLLMVLTDFFCGKLALLEKTLAFRIFCVILREHEKMLSSVKDVADRVPLAQELREAEVRHDQAAKAVHYCCKGLLRVARLDDGKRALVENVLNTFIPKLSVLKQSYEDKAAAASKARGVLEKMRPGLEALEVTSGITLFEMVSSFLNAGEQIGALLLSRAETEAEDEAGRTKQVAALRSRTIGLLGRFREALQQEIASNPELPRDLESRVFALYDHLSERRAERHPKPASPTQALAS
jgi:hypothetical protein